MTYFFSQSYPNIRAKLEKLERGPLSPQTEVLAIVFKVYHNQDERAKCQKCQMLAQALRGPVNFLAASGQPGTHPPQQGPPRLFQVWGERDIGLDHALAQGLQ